jgi:accessory gene regulator B
MSKKQGIIERLSLAGARYIKANGGRDDVSVGVMRYALQLWISLLLTVVLSVSIGALFGKGLETLIALAAIGILRYFSGGWHFRSLEGCIVFTTLVTLFIVLLPPVDHAWLASMNIISLLLVTWLAPTGHGQRFRSHAQQKVFKWVAVLIIFTSFIIANQIVSVSFLCQSLTLITLKGGRGTRCASN